MIYSSSVQYLKVAIYRWAYRWANWRAWRSTDLSTIQFRDLVVADQDGNVAARLYETENISEDGGLIVYFHGGGWVIGDLETHDPFCRRLAQETGSSVLSIDYRLAPEAVYPAAAQDCIAATRWAIAHRSEISTGSGPLVVAGDSAGGNLAGVVAQQLGAQIDGQCLIYPVIGHYNPPTQSYLDNAEGYVLTQSTMQWFWDTYYPSAAEPVTAINAPSAVLDQAPIKAGLAPAIVITAQHDPLLDEGNAYSRQLEQGGVSCEHHYFPGEQHGFVCSQGPTPGHVTAVEKISCWMKGLKPSSSGK